MPGPLAQAIRDTSAATEPSPRLSFGRVLSSLNPPDRPGMWKRLGIRHGTADSRRRSPSTSSSFGSRRQQIVGRPVPSPPLRQLHGRDRRGVRECLDEPGAFGAIGRRIERLSQGIELWLRRSCSAQTISEFSASSRRSAMIAGRVSGGTPDDDQRRSHPRHDLLRRRRMGSDLLCCERGDSGGPAPSGTNVQNVVGARNNAFDESNL